MTTKFKTPLLPFAQALRDVIEDGETTVKECFAVAGCTDQTIRNCINEVTEISEAKAHRIMVEHPSAKVRAILAAARLSGTEFHITTSEGETDIDKDGQTTIKDALLCMADTSLTASQELHSLIADASDGLSAEEVQRAVNGLRELQRKAAQTIGTITKATAGKFRPRLAHA
jgi:hypothetical protein